MKLDEIDHPNADVNPMLPRHLSDIRNDLCGVGVLFVSTPGGYRRCYSPAREAVIGAAVRQHARWLQALLFVSTQIKVVTGAAVRQHTN